MSTRLIVVRSYASLNNKHKKDLALLYGTGSGGGATYEKYLNNIYANSFAQ